MTLQNPLAGIRTATGVLGVAFVDPCGVVSRDSESPEKVSFEIPVNLNDRQTYSGSWGGGEIRPFRSGLWRIELWWGGRKIGDRGFVISQ